MTNPLHLYRGILRIHRYMPREMRFVGDQYVRSEFRSHRSVSDRRFLEPFFAQWTSYLHLLQEQTGRKAAGGNVDSDSIKRIGKHLDPQVADMLEDDKAEQLLELHNASIGLDKQPEPETRRDVGSSGVPKRP
ncbi:hypothetical protein GGH91_003558 [Coemansia sp. RSA 2671]|uniref:Uncharacterized protein n=1 Tax=Coemansia linderi TaxID=2663919 RepID=A0ACC1JZN7_9FUNG|nr:hypothetical protein LPJ60_004632 [Coemansia sp. RSA 2675]KAJ2026390.1 hypothetical protein IWW57_003052 [Coemansia sp. S610]KAJ2342323.1 hypothetical protein GGH91_003558 [Coemansia sp. RSA 2671]KAJ2703707.1 hypothetical protein H4218_000173 [Coemansia sp. IMI 209128]KAJ2770693.1 hypothetical protein GGI18_005172 [Coemansia linderi]